MPIIEAWKANPKYSTMRSVSLGFGLGLIHVGISYIYTSYLRSHFGPAHPKTSLPLNFYTSAHAAIFEEIFFRGTILPAFILFIRWVWETPITSSAAPFWLANVAQALLFGLDHRHLYTQLAELPLWLQSIIYLQTWTGLFYGWLYRRYGLEMPIIAHGTYNSLLVWSWRIFRRIPQRRII
ncbi:MAG TPA: CPBP family intramembrane glutamic endopeptidase [Candidatus Binataceae bacterium]|nr:CPBP family intramembrane glutamic endopeptidase [Candidatus Binataceae bacterium]